MREAEREGKTGQVFYNLISEVSSHLPVLFVRMQSLPAACAQGHEYQEVGIIEGDLRGRIPQGQKMLSSAGLH